MRVIAASTLRTFWQKHPQARVPLQVWYHSVMAARWNTPADIKAQYRNVSFVGHNRAIFNIKGNHYRLIVTVAWRAQAVYIKFVGTHKEYDQIDAATVEHST